jgi:hypothetical protein
MRKSVVLAVAAFLVFAFGTCAFVFAQGRSPKSEGSKPYTPTRLEWLAVELNAQMRFVATPLSEYSMIFVPLEKEDAILISVTYLPSVDRIPESRQRMNLTLDSAREIISTRSKAKGWSSWLKVRERVEPAEQK